MKPLLTLIKRQLASNRISFLVTTLVVLLATTSADSTIALSKGNYTWLLAIMTPFFFVFYNYKKLMYLGVSKKNYYLSTMATYALLALLISIVNTGIHLLIDPLNDSQIVINLMTLCEWTENGVFIAFFQQGLFLFLVMLFLHVLLSMQFYWVGWITDMTLIAVICIFTPIASLRHLLASFFNLVMFNSNALLHLTICFIFSALIALIGLLVLKRKTL